jgi:hypothetical protein
MTHLRGLKPHGYCPTWLRHGNATPEEKKGHRMISIHVNVTMRGLIPEIRISLIDTSFEELVKMTFSPQ